jgi:hypothetical protein
MARAGGRDADKLPEALAAARSAIADALGGAQRRSAPPLSTGHRGPLP